MVLIWSVHFSLTFFYTLQLSHGSHISRSLHGNLMLGFGRMFTKTVNVQKVMAKSRFELKKKV